LKLAGGAAAAASLPAWTATARAALDPAPFALGVASGDPTTESVVLWTRLFPGPFDAPVQVRWELASNEAFTRVVARGTAWAVPQHAHSVHKEVFGLQPGRWYWYRFDFGGAASVVGRTRTLPPSNASAEPLRFGFASCQSWADGPYPAYRDMAEHDLDFVLHLGDYIYETSRGDLAEYRRLHELYKSSPDLRRAHALFPFITTWDDHEVQNNYAGGAPGGGGTRRLNGYKAYYEHLPLRRESEPLGPNSLLYKRFAWGRLAEFSVLDTRQYRSDQSCGDGRREPCEETFDPARTMTGPAQERWLLDGLARSRARWNVVAQQTIMAQFDYDLGPEQVFNLDQWDGYPPARSRILEAVRDVSNPVVLSGDWHSNWVNDLKADFADPDSDTIATEFVGTSISSGIGWDAAVREGLDANPHVVFYEGGYRGWVRCEVTRDRWESTLRIVTAPRDAASPAYTLAAFEVASGRPGARRLDAGTGVAGRVTGAGGAGLRNVEIQVRTTDGALVVERPTGADGEFTLFVPPGTYTVSANGVGHEPASQPVTVTGAEVARADFALTPVTLFAGTGRMLPGARAEARASDVVLENARLALAVSAGTEDGQLSPATVGKPLDLAAVGHVDQLDWMNLPYASAARPLGQMAWQQRTVRSTAVEVVSPGVVRAVGASTAVPALEVVTTYTLEAGHDSVAASSNFVNRGDAPASVWVGDVIDHDGAGQRSGVAGHGTITTPFEVQREYAPSGRWIGMTGTDGQTYGVVYDDGAFVAYGNGNWIMSQRQVTIEPGETFTLARRIVAASNGFGDPWAVLG
jgi:phosphodiesterase/alkaline phosphatase D-like protein